MAETTLDILINPRGAREGAAQVRAALTGIGQTARTTIDQMNDRFQRLRSSLFSVQTALAGLGIAAFVRDTIHVGIGLERAERGLRGVTVSAGAARAQLDRIRQIADQFQLFDDQAMANAFRLLVSNNIPNAERALGTLANAAAQTGLAVEDATMAILAGEERRLRQLGIQLIDLGQGEVDLVFGNMEIRAKKTDEAIRRGLLELLERGLPKASETLGDSLEFQFARVKDAFEDFQAAVMRGGLQDFLAATFKTFADSFDPAGIEESGRRTAEAIIKMIKAVGGATANLIDLIAPFATVVLKVLGAGFETFNTLPREIQAVGIIGAMFFGVKGPALILGALTLIDLLKSKLEAFGGKDFARAAGAPAIVLAIEQLLGRKLTLGKGAEGEPGGPMFNPFEGLAAATVGELSSAREAFDKFMADVDKNLDVIKTKREQEVAKAKAAGTFITPGPVVDENTRKLDAQMAKLKGDLKEQIDLEKQKRDVAFSPELAAAEQKALETIQGLEKSGLVVSEEKAAVIKDMFRDLAKAQQATAIWNDELQLSQERATRVHAFLQGTADALRDAQDAGHVLQQPAGLDRRTEEIRLQMIRQLERERVPITEEVLKNLQAIPRALAEQERHNATLLQQEQRRLQHEERMAQLQGQLAELDEGMTGGQSFVTRLNAAQREAERLKLDFNAITEGARISKEMDAERAVTLSQLNLSLDRQIQYEDRLYRIGGRLRPEREAELLFLEKKNQLLEQGIRLTPSEEMELKAKARDLVDTRELARGGEAFSRFVDSFEVGFAQIERSGEQAYSHLEDALVAFVQTGKLEMGNLVNFIQQELIRLSIRNLISQALGAIGGTQGVFSIFTNLFSSTPAPTTAPATGGSAFAAEGGIFTRPTQTWIAEAGDPELALPLNQQGADFVRRAIGSPDGQGITVVVNNYTDAEVTAQQGRGSDGKQTIEVMIRDTTKKLMGQGAFDRDLKTNFGIARKGVTG
jgi:hypothetical protein